MFQLRNCFNISIRIYRQVVIPNIIEHHQLFCTTNAIKVSRNIIGSENTFAHTVLEINPKCRVLRGEQNETNVVESADIDFDQNWESLTTSGIVDCLKAIGNYCNQSGTTISDERFDKFVDVCTERCFDFTDDQLIHSLQILTRYPSSESPKARNFVELWKALDDACVERIDAWDFDMILYVCDHWHMLRLGRINKFIFRASLQIGKKFRKLLPHQLVQLMFYLSIKRIEVLDMIEIERNFMNSMDDLSLNEVAVVCLGFSNSQAKMKNPDLVKQIYTRSIQEIDTVESTALTSILKALRHSCKTPHLGLVREMLNAAADQLPRLSPLTCLHVALLGTHLHLCYESCIEQILHRFSDDVKSIRMIDVERLSYLIGFFDIESESNIENRLCEQFLVELKNRVDDIVKHPKKFALCLHYLTMKGYYDEEMISVALSAKFLKSTYGNQDNYGREIFGLDSFAKINLRGTYTGNELTEKNRRYLGRMKTDYIPDRRKEFKIGFADNILLELKESSDELFTHSYLAHALPHFSKPDILIAYDKTSNSGIDIAHNLPPDYTGTIIDRSMLVEGLNIDTANVEIVNVIVGDRTNYVRDTLKVNGVTRQKIEQSKILGLRPVLVPYFNWEGLDTVQRTHYIKQRVNEALCEK